MDETRAMAIVDHVRRFTDTLFAELKILEAQWSPEEKAIWHSHFGHALGGLHDHLLIPIERLHPAVIPKSMGGQGPDRPLKSE